MLYLHRKIHNDLVEKAKSLLPISFGHEPDGKLGHAWAARVSYKKQKDKEGYHSAVLTAGLVNGIPAAIRMVFKEAPPDTQERIKKERDAQNKPKLADTAMVDSFLDENASVRLHWRRIGAGANPTSATVTDKGKISYTFEKVPEFFKRLGVKDASNNPLGYESLDLNVRYLTACDLVLHQPRPTIFTALTTESVIGGTQLTAAPGYQIPKDLQPRVVALEKFVAVNEEPISPRDVLYRQYTDPPADLVHLSTVYALSPANPVSENPDASWQTFVKYNIHWNLVHASRVQTYTPPNRLTLFTGLAAGVGDTLFNFILAQNNDWAAALANLVSSNRAYGKFFAV